ncbi:toll-like receptor 2 [Genypterus blacodes]|uniref:toll-like receptor 2 n=1 Tax=Genypterus blacodes TaxID=154954 RepID=UPI003F7658F7
MRVYVFLVLVHLLTCLSSASASVSRPRCHHCEKPSYCDCSRQNLWRIPVIPSKDIAELDLSFNKLWSIMNNEFHGYGSLQSLTMSNNKIQTIQEEAFVPLSNLKELDISSNILESLSGKWFKNLVSLQHLNLLGNNYKTLGQGHLFQPLKGLRRLELGGPYLQSITINDFSGLSEELEELFFRGEHLQSYMIGSLRRIAPIRRVSIALGGLFERDPTLAEVLMSDVANPNTTLTFADTKFDKADHMVPFKAANKGGTTHLRFKNSSMTLAAFVALLRMLSYSNVTLFVVEDAKLFLTHFDLGLSPLKLNNLGHIVFKNLEVPQFYSFPAFFFLAPVMKVLHSLSVINSSVFAVPCETSVDLSNLQYLDISSNFIDDFRLVYLMCDGKDVFQGLQTINISKNYLQSINSQLFTKLDNLKNIDMSGNKFYRMPENCSWPANLQFLNLSSTRLTTVTDCLPKSLWILDLSHNDLTVFDIGLPCLKELYISGNKIAALPSGSLYPHLTFLSIPNNNLPTFSSDGLNDYGMLGYLEAGSNSYICSCDFVALMADGLTGHRVELRDRADQYICESPDSERGKAVRDAHLSVFECHMALALSLLCSGIMAVLLLTVGLCHKFNVLWYMKMTWAWLRAKRKPVLKRAELKYDAFVSYSQMDSGWVEAHLIPELEQNEPRLRLCLHGRHFVPGGWILDNIIDSIEKSHRTLFVLSQHFIRSEWCKYELDYSHFRLLDQNTDLAVLILLEPIDKQTIPKRFCKLRNVMNSRTYLEWPDDEAHLPRFWQSLRRAIKRPENDT